MSPADLVTACGWLRRRLHGRLVEDAASGLPRVDFDASGRPARLQFVPGAWSPDRVATRVEVDLHGLSPGILKIYPERLTSSIAKIFGAQDLLVGVDRFDKKYVVKSWPVHVAGRLFRLRRRAAVIAAVERIARHPGLRIDLTRERLAVQVGARLDQSLHLMEIVSTAKEFVAWILEVDVAVGVEFIEEVVVAPVGECQICGYHLKQNVVRCARCRTPHHGDCWEYTGVCSTFGCGSAEAEGEGRKERATRLREEKAGDKTVKSPANPFSLDADLLGSIKHKRRKRRKRQKSKKRRKRRKRPRR